MALVMACQPQGRNKSASGSGDQSPLSGNWQFLDKFGNYNEAYFADSVYQTINRFVDRNLRVSYTIHGDTLRSVVPTADDKRVILARLAWIDNDHVVISTEFVSDTLSRMENPAITLQNTDPFRDSLKFFTAFNERYVEYLILKGIVTEEEVRAFRERGEVPVDVMRQMPEK